MPMSKNTRSCFILALMLMLLHGKYIFTQVIDFVIDQTNTFACHM